MARVEVDTAMKDKLVDLPPGSSATGWKESGWDPDIYWPPIYPVSKEEAGLRMRVAQLLQIPQVSIEAGAREIALLLTRMADNRDKPWQQAHGFGASGPEGDAIYDHMAGGAGQGEADLAEAVSGAYISPAIITAMDASDSIFPNAVRMDYC